MLRRYRNCRYYYYYYYYRQVNGVSLLPILFSKTRERYVAPLCRDDHATYINRMHFISSSVLIHRLRKVLKVIGINALGQTEGSKDWVRNLRTIIIGCCGLTRWKV